MSISDVYNKLNAMMEPMAERMPTELFQVIACLKEASDNEETNTEYAHTIARMQIKKIRSIDLGPVADIAEPFIKELEAEIVSESQPEPQPEPQLPAQPRLVLTEDQAFALAELWPRMTPRQRFTVINTFKQEGGELILKTLGDFFPEEEPKKEPEKPLSETLHNVVEEAGKIAKVAADGMAAAAMFRLMFRL